MARQSRPPRGGSPRSPKHNYRLPTGLARRRSSLSHKKYKSQCRPCSVRVYKMDFERWFRERDDCTRESSLLERDGSSDKRLVSQENGMVLLPRTFYNKHPAKAVGQRRTSARLHDTPKKKTPQRIKRRDINSNGAKEDAECRMYVESKIKASPPPRLDFTLKNLSELMDGERLPSSMWEVERIPPLIDFRGKTDSSYDAIAAELEELMGESKKVEVVEKMDVDTKPEIVPDSNPETVSEPKVVADLKSEIDAEKSPIDDEKSPIEVDSNLDVSVVESVTKPPETEKVQDDYPSIMDILNEIPKEPSAENKSNADKESTKSVDVQSDEKSDKPSEADDANKQSPDEDVHTNSTEKSDDIVENKLEIDTAAEPATENNVEIKKQEDAPPKEESETEEKQIPMEVEVTDNNSAVEEPAAVAPDETPKENVPKTELDNNNDEYLLKSVIFRRLTEDKQTYDRLVTFQENMEYFVAINDRKVELLGAPEFITSICDVQILLQIVDEANLNSFNVDCS